MTTPLVVGAAPYISPETLVNAPTGIDFSTIPTTPDFDPAANNAEMWNLCQRATAMADEYCNQVLRATVDTEILHGPDYRVIVGPQAGGGYPTPYWGTAGSNARCIMSRWPIVSVSEVRVSPNTFPRNWQTVPAGYAEPEYPPFGMWNSVAPADDAYGGQAILVAAGYVNRCLGRNGYILQITYVNGWPHTALTAAAAAGATTISVTDATGWALSNYENTVTGATGVFKDGAQEESATVTASSVAQGPGTLTLSSALQYDHPAGTIFTTMPASIEQACILYGAAQALVRGATTTTIHSVGGHAQSSGGDISEYSTEAELLLHPFRRTI